VLLILAALVVQLCSMSFGEEDLNAISALSHLADMSLEDLTNIDVSSVSKRKEKRHVAAAAIHVITQEDIRRSAATRLPGLLRTVPGIHVARLDANKWSVSSRGFGGRFAPSMLVLIDGRNVYTPSFSGVYWETRDVMLEDVEQIEVIRGPGGNLWGANAVNGVINIVTKRAQNTQGGLLSAGGGTEESGFGALRYGGPVGENGAYRVYAKYFQRDDAVFDSGQDANDGWLSARGGARFDWNWGDTRATVQGDIYGTDTSQSYSVPMLRFPYVRNSGEGTYLSGGNVLVRWARTFSDDSELSLQTYYDRSESNFLPIRENRDTLDFELQHRLAARERHEVIWGVGFRYIDNRSDGREVMSMAPEGQRKRLFSAFLQNRISLTDELTLTLGSKLEHNDFTGFEVQPSVRVAWAPNSRHTMWGAVSRAVRTPSIFEETGRVLILSVPFVGAGFYGNSRFESEELLSFELGYRVRASDNLSLDLALYLNRYDNLRTLELGLPFLEFSQSPVHFALPAHINNNMDGNTYGLELGVDWKPKPWWRVRVHYALLEMDLRLNTKSLDIYSGSVDDASPEQQAFLMNSFDLPGNMEIDFMLRYVDLIPALDVDDYLAMDVRFAWRPSEDFEISITGHDLLESGHAEYGPSFVNIIPTQVQRGVFGKLTWRF
jgi:iron complex outermembrane recepter protein